MTTVTGMTFSSQLLQDSDPDKSERVTRAMLQMKKLDLPALQRAYNHQDA